MELRPRVNECPLRPARSELTNHALGHWLLLNRLRRDTRFDPTSGNQRRSSSLYYVIAITFWRQDGILSATGRMPSHRSFPSLCRICCKAFSFYVYYTPYLLIPCKDFSCPSVRLSTIANYPLHWQLFFNRGEHDNGIGISM